MKNSIRTGIFFAIIAAALYALNSPLSKLLLDYMPSTLMAGFLYIGAGIGMAFAALIRRFSKNSLDENKLTKKDFRNLHEIGANLIILPCQDVDNIKDEKLFLDNMRFLMLLINTSDP